MVSNVKIERIKKNVSQAEMARQLGVSRPAYRHYEENPGDARGEILGKLAQIFGCTIDYLLKGANE